MNPFERHGITMLSASSIALYRAEPAFWVLKHLYRIKDEAGPSAWRGRAVEAGVNHILFEDCSDDVAADIALATFEQSASGDLDEKVDKHRQAVAPMVRQASNLLRAMGPPVMRQKRVEQWLDGIEVPLVGYVDYVWPDDLQDLKTTLRLPSKPLYDHQAQVVSYADATGLNPGLAYVTPAKARHYPCLAIDVTAGRRAIELGARAIRSLLTRVDDREEAASLFSPNPEDYHWTEQTLAIAKEIWT